MAFGTNRYYFKLYTPCFICNFKKNGFCNYHNKNCQEVTQYNICSKLNNIKNNEELTTTHDMFQENLIINASKIEESERIKRCFPKGSSYKLEGW